MKTILCTGDRGYCGGVLVPYLLQRGYRVIGLDTDWFSHCFLEYDKMPYGRYGSFDIRDAHEALLKDVDAVIHLAALSNDPLGEFNPKLTYEINCDAAIRLAAMAKQCGVKRFIFASTQSIYGMSDTDKELDEDAPKNPQTAYAKSKWEAEQWIRKLADQNFTVIALRPATVFGPSPRLRCDIVFNNLVACAYTTGKIEVHSDGTPWRPVVHIQDLCAAFHAALEIAPEIANGKAYNVSSSDYTVSEMALAVQQAIPNTMLFFTGDDTDSRSYRVSSKRFLDDFGFEPEQGIGDGSRELVPFFRRVGLTEAQFRGRTCNRLAQLKWLVETGKLNEDLRCVSRS